MQIAVGICGDDLITDDRILDEPDELAFGLSDAESLAGIVCNCDLKLLIFFHNSIRASALFDACTSDALTRVLMFPYTS